MVDIYPRVLLVEGKQDRFVIPELIEANGVNWGTRKNPVVFIRDYDGYQKLVDPDVISTELQASGLSALGIMIDADDNPTGRWQSIRSASLKSIPDLPETLPEDGLIHTTSRSPHPYPHWGLCRHHRGHQSHGGFEILRADCLE